MAAPEGTVHIGATLDALAKVGPIDLPAALRSVSALMLQESDDAFARRGWRGGTTWAPRMVPNVPGILRALGRGEGKSWRARWGEDGPPLQDSGRLRQSMTTRIDVALASVTLGTNVEYAALHQTGGPVTLPAAGRGSSNPAIRPRLYALLKTAPKAMRARLGWLFGVDEVTINVRKRPVVELTPEILRDVKAAVLKHRVGGKA